MNASFFIPAKIGSWDGDIKNNRVNCFLQDSFPDSHDFYLFLTLGKPEPDVMQSPWGWPPCSTVAPSSSAGCCRSCSLLQKGQLMCWLASWLALPPLWRLGTPREHLFQPRFIQVHSTAQGPHTKPREGRSVSLDPVADFLLSFFSGYPEHKSNSYLTLHWHRSCCSCIQMQILIIWGVLTLKSHFKFLLLKKKNSKLCDFSIWMATSNLGATFVEIFWKFKSRLSPFCLIPAPFCAICSTSRSIFGWLLLFW